MLLFLLSVAQTESDKNKIIKLYKTHGHAIEQVAYKLTNGNEYMAEDALQEMWLSAMERMETKRFESPQAELAYLYAILRSKVCDLQRAYGQIAEHEIQDEDIDAYPSGPDNDILELLCAAEECQNVASIIRCMSLQDQESIIVYMREGQNISQMAAALNLNPDTARMRLYRARKRLVMLCKKEGIIYD